MPIKLPTFRQRREAYPPDLWTKCPSCEEMQFNKRLDKVLRICPNCGHHFRLSAPARIELLVDEGTFEERDEGLQSVDPLGFVDQKPYPDRVAAAQAATGLRDAAMWGMAQVGGRPVAICVMDFAFMGGSMGAVVGEKVARAAETALEARIPLIVVSASGGARMQEGTLALMQLAKTVAALERLRAEGVPYVSILTDPTTGGVFASYAALGDVNIAEPNALIGFAGARVNAGTISAELPPGFQRSEFLYEHGFLDRIVHRSELRAELTSLLGYLVPLTFEAPATIETLSVPAFRPLSFLTALAERVIPDGDSSVAASAQAEPATPAERVEPDAPVVADATEPVAAAPAGDGVTGSTRSRNGKAARNGKNGKAARTAQPASVDPEPGEGVETEQVTDRG
ncbi:MAG TPA: acetyl-CoA carboxylase, carboxyltransferase subunit beta [Candidatus Binatia bacterium]|nr:acetyl-CoA carboxylase, carboxyltransferase subunit beta [Candidatus Binatia bacterium]